MHIAYIMCFFNKHSFLMKKLIVIAFTLCIANLTYASYLDAWSNDELCGWTSAANIPEHIQKEVEKREILCYGGVEVASLPSEADLSSEHGTVFASPDPASIPETKSDKNNSSTYY